RTARRFNDGNRASNSRIYERSGRRGSSAREPGADGRVGSCDSPAEPAGVSGAGTRVEITEESQGRAANRHLVDRETGEVIDELPPDAVLRMMAELEKEREEE